MRLRSLLHTLAAGGVLVVGLGVAGGSAVARRPHPLPFGDGRRWPLSRFYCSKGGRRSARSCDGRRLRSLPRPRLRRSPLSPLQRRPSCPGRRSEWAKQLSRSRRGLAMANGLWGELGQALREAQLVRVDALGLVSMVVQAARRWDACRRLGQHVELVGGLLRELELAELMRRDATRRPLERLHGAHPLTTRARSYRLPPAEGEEGERKREKGEREEEGKGLTCKPHT
uniref:Uncharacterized protein n=1 Tax=Oryza sativa subsp. japonica TaxID=39947 RepID=Q2QU29_ORYSJ|nr:hypothetical protein LOC_Os12g17680 [Oryza sativa Japonica Group]